MLITYLSIYLLVVIFVSLILSLIIWKLELPTSRMVVGLIVAIVLFPGVFGYFYFTYYTSLPETVVPDLAGLPLETAVQKLGSLELRGRHAGSVFDETYPEGSVVNQRPEAGRRVKIGRYVSLLTSSGRRRGVVPNLLGRPLTQVEAVLSARGLLLGEVRQEPVPELDPGIVLTQNPLPGEEVDANTAVSVSVSGSAEAAGGPVKEEEKKEGGFRLPWW